jgi:hypothetical protein
VVELPLLVTGVLFANDEELSAPSGGEAVLTEPFHCFLDFHQISLLLGSQESRGRLALAE